MRQQIVVVVGKIRRFTPVVTTWLGIDVSCCICAFGSQKRKRTCQIAMLIVSPPLPRRSPRKQKGPLLWVVCGKFTLPVIGTKALSACGLNSSRPSSPALISHHIVDEAPTHFSIVTVSTLSLSWNTNASCQECLRDNRRSLAYANPGFLAYSTLL